MVTLVISTEKSVQNGVRHLVLLKVLRDISAGECHTT